jgi:hypothetical protein
MTTLSSNGGPLAATANGDTIQVSAGQRMLSATWGSVLTSLLGEDIPYDTMRDDSIPTDIASSHSA